MNQIKIENKTIGLNYPTYFVADVAANHDGDIERAKDLIYLCAEAGADAAKFQHFSAKTIVSDYGFKIKHFRNHSDLCLAGEDLNFIKNFNSTSGVSIFKPVEANKIFPKEDFLE